MERIRQSTWLVIVAVALGAQMTACGEAPVGPSPYSPFIQTDLLFGTGTEAVVSNRVTVHYTLWLFDRTGTANKGLQIESSVDGTPFSFVLGSGDVIEGWNRGVAGMRVGGIRRLVVPPSLAYGQDRNGIIPPNSTLLFDIELLDVTSS